LNTRPSLSLDEPAAAGRLCALFHEAGDPAPRDEEIAWYLARLPGGGDPVLDLCCGFGRLLVPLVTAGRKLHGVDVSPAMLATCAARLAADKLPPLFRQDVCDLNLPFRYAAAYASGGALQGIVDSARARVALERVRAHLVPPGILLLEMFVPSDSVQRIAAPLVEVRTARLSDDTRIAQRSETAIHVDAKIAHVDSRYVHRRGNAKLSEERESRRVTWYSPEEASALVAEAGFCDVTIEVAPREAPSGTAFALLARA
jgi:SAM-dependent methyltransferase